MQQDCFTTGAAGQSFWRFSLAFYARSGVADALVALQDRAERNVNVIVFLLWLGATRGRALDAAALAAAEGAVADLDSAVIVPLRRLRRRLRASADRDIEALRRQIAGIEVAAERRAQHRLSATLPAGSGDDRRKDRLAVAAANLALYLGAEAASVEAAVLRQALAELMRRA